MPLGEAFSGLEPGQPLVAAVTLASEESKITIQNRPTVLNTGEYTGDLRCALVALPVVRSCCLRLVWLLLPHLIQVVLQTICHEVVKEFA